MRKVLVLSILGVVLVAGLSSCSSGEKKSEDKTTSTTTTKTTVSNDEIGQKYSLTELNAAATALRAIADEGMSKSKVDKGSELIGCPMTSQQAMSMTMPIKALIDQALRTETAAYTENPKGYTSEKGFETCAASCSCGIYSDVIDASNESTMPAGSAKIHARNKQRLSTKAARQGRADTLTCAKKASWFCGSDLKSYLEKDARDNAAE